MSKNFAKLSPNDIGIDATYQRDLDESRVDSIAKRFDETRAGVPVLSVRKGGTYVVLDGQHRLAAMRKAGLESHKIMCEVHNGLTVAQEAELFLKLNNGRKSVGAFDKYRARLIAGEPVAIEFTAILESLGLKIGRVPSRNTICAILAIESVHRRNRNLETTLTVLKKWGRGESGVFDGDLVKDVSRFLLDHTGEIAVDDFVAKLMRFDPGHVLRKIRATSDVLGRNRRLAANSVLREIYNHRRSKKERLGAVEFDAGTVFA